MSEQLEATGRIVVGTDLSHNADHAVDWAAARAVAHGVPLLIVTVLPDETVPRRLLPHHVVGPDMQDDLRRRAAERLAALGDRVRETHEGLQIETRVVEGRPSYVLASASREADMVVVGARGETAPVAVRTLGGTSDAVTAHAHGPVAVIRTDTRIEAEGPIVVGIDDSKESMAAVSFAVAEAVATGVDLVAAHVWDATPMLLGSAGMWTGDGSRLGVSLEGMVDEIMRPYLEDNPGLRSRTLVLPGRAAPVLADAAHEASMIVIGSRGRHGFAGLLLGSTSREVLRAADCPVVVVRT